MEYIIRDYKPEDEERVLSLMQIGMGGGPTGTRERDFWQWKHFDNPFGMSIAIVAATDSGELIGLRTFMRWRFQVGGLTYKAVRAVDTVTHPDYRRFGVFSRLTKAALDRVKEDGVDFIFNTPNEQVLPGYIKLGWHYVDLVRPSVKVLHFPRFVKALVLNRGKNHSSQQLTADQVFKQGLPTIPEFFAQEQGIRKLISESNKIRTNKIATEQSLEYLIWRYGGQSFCDYRILAHKSHGELDGCLILRPSTRFGLKEVVVDELLISEHNKNTVSSLLLDLKRITTADYLIAFFPRNSFDGTTFRKKGFYQIPKQGQNFTVRTLDGTYPHDPKAIENWHLSLGDLEVF